MRTFNLPDLGEGLPDAEIVRWLVKEGDTINLDQPMVEMETAKAVVEVPSPYQGKVTKLCGNPGDVIEVGAVLVEFDGSNQNDDQQSDNDQQSNREQSKEPRVESSQAKKNDNNQIDKGTIFENLAPESGGSVGLISDVFNLPDLGEGLPDAEIVRWLVKEGDSLTLDQPMVEMETAKAVVEVPSPVTATVAKLHGQAGDVIEVGAPLVSFGDVSTSQASTDNMQADTSSDKGTSSEAATVVGAMQVGNQVVVESANAVVKALARKLKVDLSQVVATGKDGKATQADVKKAKKEGKLIQKANTEIVNTNSNGIVETNPLDFKASPAVRAYAYRQGVILSKCRPTGVKGSITKSDIDAAKASGGSNSHTKSKKAMSPSTYVKASTEPQRVRGVRLAMAMGMEQSHSVVVPTTLMEDADITSWPKQDSLARYVRALVYASKIEPSLNCWFDREKSERIVHPQVHVGLAVDSPDGLYVPVIHDAQQKSATAVRARVEELREKIQSKSLKQEDQKGATITLSNFGSIAGRYGTPVVSPPQVAILGTGRFREELKMNGKGIVKHKMLPLSLTFDHRACTGGEAARFLAAVIEDLEKPA